MAGFIRLLRSKWNPPTNPTTDFTSQTVLITGANVGLGLESAIKYAESNAFKVILGVRNPKKGQAAKTLIEERTNRTGVVEVWQLDMNTFESVKHFAERVDRDLDRLDVAVLNAGVYKTSYEVSPEGWEETLQVNLFSTALLELLLLPKLRASRTPTATSHLTIVASNTHVHAKVTPEQLTDPLNSFNRPSCYGDWQYATSKLFVMQVTREIAARVLDKHGEPEVIINDCCPGLCRSTLGREYEGFFMNVLIAIFFAIFARSTEEGSRTIVSASALGRESHGKWWKDDEIAPAGRWIISDEGKQLQKRVWHDVMEVLEQKVPEVAKIL
ncbi:MAG: hypothetical protein M1817_001507 [Caeruleum heppii]|nr:MAG: hypothetical protein M1817_001507 [Caeruleum heppii]